jgi:hypothetical protein
MAKPKKIKKEEVIIEDYANGQIDDDEIERVKKLEKILNIESVNPFKTNDFNVFEKNMKEYSISDLQSLCRRVGIYPTHSRQEMRKKLEKEFYRVTKGQRSVSLQGSTGICDPSHPDHEKIKRQMSID